MAKFKDICNRCIGIGILGLFAIGILKIIYDVLSTIYDWGLLFESLILIIVVWQLRKFIKKISAHGGGTH